MLLTKSNLVIKVSKIIDLFIVKLLPKMWAVKEMEYLSGS